MIRWQSQFAEWEYWGSAFSSYDLQCFCQEAVEGAKLERGGGVDFWWDWINFKYIKVFSDSFVLFGDIFEAIFETILSLFWS